MAFSWSEESLPAGTTNVSVDIEYLDKSYIHLYLDDVETTDFIWASDNLIQLNTPLTATTRVLLVRRTEKEYLYILFSEGAAFIRENVDTQNTQFLHLAQELTEGRSIEGFFGNFSMNGYRITNLGDGVNPGDAVNKGQLDVVDQRVSSLEETWVTDTTSYPWYTLTTAETDVLDPPFNFIKAALYIDGVCQTPGYSYEVVDNQIMLADPVPAGTLIFARLGEDVGLDTDYATADQLAAAVSQAEIEHTALQTDINGKASKGANSDITSLSGLTTPLSQAQGGTGNASGNINGNAATATKLATPHNIVVDLTSAAAASFDGSANATPGVSGALPVSHGGTGSTTAIGGRTALGAAASGSNSDITALTGLAGGITGNVTGTAAAAGIVGQVLETTGTGTALTTATDANIATLALTAGEWDVFGVVQYVSTGNMNSYQAGVTTSASAYGAFQTQTRSAVSFNASATVIREVPVQRIRLSASGTVYLRAQSTFSSGTITATGYIRATRVR